MSYGIFSIKSKNTLFIRALYIDAEVH